MRVLFRSSLLCRGPWHVGCGWHWGGVGQTARLMESLKKRGVVEMAERPATVLGNGNVYRLSRRGLADALAFAGIDDNTARRHQFHKHGHSYNGEPAGNEYGGLVFS